MQLLLDHKEKAGQAKASFRSSMATTFHQLLRSTGRRRRNIYARVGTGSRSSSRRWDHPPAYSEGSFCSKGSLQQAALFHSFSIYPTSLSQVKLFCSLSMSSYTLSSSNRRFLSSYAMIHRMHLSNSQSQCKPL
ncbi:hypothetical protein O6H91_Y411300 [Diphasiastrum complanatum]|nr:hypothetical protein O6H91_Y411300 [Diphasiastrum complanatum]